MWLSMNPKNVLKIGHIFRENNVKMFVFYSLRKITRTRPRDHKLKPYSTASSLRFPASVAYFQTDSVQERRNLPLRHL